MRRGRTGRQLTLWLLFGAAMCIAPLVLPPGTVRVMIFANFLAIFAMSWDVISGRTGYISFGHPFLIGLAAYTSAILSYHLDWPLWLTIPAGVLAAVVGGTLFFLPALRIRGTYFALVTLAFMELIYEMTKVVAPGVTGGTRGLSGIDSVVKGAVPNFYVSFAITFAVGIAVWLLFRTRMGAALGAIRMDEEAVTDSGLSTTRLKLFAFIVSAFIAGVGGAFYTHYLGSIAPRGLFDINFLFTILVAALLGGSGTVAGPILGAYFLTFLLEYLRPVLPGPERYFIYGSIALVVYVLEPRGLHRIISKTWQRLAPRRWQELIS